MCHKCVLSVFLYAVVKLGSGLWDHRSCHVIFHCMWRSDVSSLHWKDIGELKMHGIHNVLWSADNNDRSYCFGKPASWLTRHRGSGVSAFDFFHGIKWVGKKIWKGENPEPWEPLPSAFSSYPWCVLGCSYIVTASGLTFLSLWALEMNVHDSVSVWENESRSHCFTWKLCF